LPVPVLCPLSHPLLASWLPRRRRLASRISCQAGRCGADGLVIVCSPLFMPAIYGSLLDVLSSPYTCASSPFRQHSVDLRGSIEHPCRRGFEPDVCGTGKKKGQLVQNHSPTLPVLRPLACKWLTIENRLFEATLTGNRWLPITADQRSGVGTLDQGSILEENWRIHSPRALWSWL